MESIANHVWANVGGLYAHVHKQVSVGRGTIIIPPPEIAENSEMRAGA